ncbi:MAG: biphenyl 2,3-dioxygenase [Gammaproteobacteria bacterium]|nr:biphenyl 2,3-dioxygenase [Gammaproteobacteria bacterium]
MTRKLNPTSLIRPVRFAHIVLQVRDIERSIAWYQTVLGMETVHHAGVIAFMTFDEEHHRIAFLETQVEAECPKGAPGLDHLAYTFNDLGQLLSTFVRLKDLDIHPYWQINHGPTTSLYYRDPDENGVELQIDNFATADELKGWMRSDEFKANPIGVPFDADKLAARYQAGDSIDELLAQGATS